MSVLLEQAKEWLNEYIAPHQLVSITVHEDSHPNVTKTVRCIIAHRAGASPMKLKESPAAKDLPLKGLYTLYTTKGGADKTWEEIIS